MKNNMEILNISRIDGVISLDNNDHKYMIDGIKHANQISVSSLVSGQYNHVETNEAMRLGTEVHEELGLLLTGQNSNPVSKQALCLREHIIRSVGDVGSIELEHRMGVEVEFENGNTLYVFGSVDCLFRDIDMIVEFKTSTKEYPGYKWQLSLYRLLYRYEQLARSGTDIWGKIVMCNLNGPQDYSNITVAETFDYFAARIARYISHLELKDLGKNNTNDISALYHQYRELEEAAAIAKKQFEAEVQKSLEAQNIVGEIYQADVGGVVVKRSPCFRTSYNAELIREKLPEALQNTQYYRTIYSVC